MPGFDGKGPENLGPTGRRLGPCSGETARADRRFFGFRRGGGRGFRGFWQINNAVVDEKTLLQRKKAWLTEQLAALNELLDD